MMYALFWNGARVTDWYNDRSRLIQSDEYIEFMRQGHCGTEIRSM